MHYYAGDIPAEPVVLEPVDREGDPRDLEPFTGVEVQLIDPAGGAVTAAGLVGSITETQDGTSVVQVTWSTTSVLELAGLYALRVTLTGPGRRERLGTKFVVVELEDSPWATLDEARDPDVHGWREAQSIGDVKLWRLLEIARLAVLEYAPTLTEGQRPPVNYIEAQLLQARNTWNAGRVNPGGEDGGDDFAITPHPLDWQVKQLLRPKSAVPKVG